MPTPRNYVELEGRLTKNADITHLPRVSFTLAVTDLVWDKEAGRDAVGDPIFIAVDYWAPAPPDDTFYVGDLVLAIGSLGQSKEKVPEGEPARSHLRLIAKQVILLRRSRRGAEQAQQPSKAEEAY